MENPGVRKYTRRSKSLKTVAISFASLAIFMLAAFLVLYFFLWLGHRHTTKPTNPVPEAAAASPNALTYPFDPCGLETVVCPAERTVAPHIAHPSKLAKITAFSTAECHTAWCRANTGPREGHKVALNARFGKVKQIRIPVLGKVFDVIGTSDSLTDADIWFGSDYEGAKQFGVQHLIIQTL